MAPFRSYTDALRTACDVVQPRTVLEWGPGDSTLLIAGKCPHARIVSIEHSPHWFQACQSRFAQAGLKNVELHWVAYSLSPGRSKGYATWPLRRKLEQSGPSSFDLIFVDGRARCDCLVVARQLLSERGLVVLHDCERSNYQPGWKLFPHAENIGQGVLVATANAPLKAEFQAAMRQASPTPSLDSPVLTATICVLLYGDYLELAKRCIGSIHRRIANQPCELRIGLNAVGEATSHWIKRELAHYPNIRVYASEENIFKYPMMRRLFFEDPITTPWVIWFDDDSHVCDDNWLPDTARFLAAEQHDCIGKPYFMCLKPGQLRWIAEATWYRGRPQRMHKGLTPKSNFVTGGYWLIRSEILRELDWPDRRLQNNGGDVMLGEALHQHGYSISKFWSGVEISDHPRRGASQNHPGT